MLPSQQHIAYRAEILMRGLAHVGIVALVDEATGYLEIRNRKSLQELLDKYLLPYQARWGNDTLMSFTRRFSDSSDASDKA